MSYVYLVLALAFMIDVLIGDPVYRLHPVRLIGDWAGVVEKIFFRAGLTSVFWGGIFWALVVIPVSLIFAGIYSGLKYFHVNSLNLGFQVVAVYSFIAFRDMLKHSRPIYKYLIVGNISGARDGLQKIVGRDTESLTADDISRACVESISESFVDGFFAPLFIYFAAAVGAFLMGADPNLASLGAIAFYRGSNTLDSMVGYRNHKYEKFGKFSARVDDILNFIPARLCIISILPGIIVTGRSPVMAIKTFIQDRFKSSSPNAGHPMSLYSGALRMRLGGGAVYSGKKIKKPWIGENFNPGGPKKILAAARIFLMSGIFSIIIFCSAMYIIIR